MKRMRFLILLGGAIFSLMILEQTRAEMGDGLDIGTRLTIPALIDQTLREGTIDESTAVKYKILYFKRPDLLPQVLQANRDVPLGCATILLLEIRRGYDLLDSEDRKWLAEEAGLPDLPAILARPVSNHTIQSSSYPIRVHYENPDQAALAAVALQAAEYSWQRECDEIGFIEPPPDYGVEGSDDYDVYIAPMDPGWSGYCAAESPYEETWWFDYTSYIALNETLSENGILSTQPHEFNHACQSATAAEEHAAIWENSAQWAIPHVYFDQAPVAWWSIGAFQAAPWRAISGYTGIEPYQYGGLLWPEYLEDRFNGWEPDLVAEMWDWCRDEPGSNEHNYFDSFVHLANLHDPNGPDGDGWTIRDLIMDFSQWRYLCGPFLDDGAHFTHGEEFPSARIEEEHRHTFLPAVSPSELPMPPQFFGVNFIRLDEGIEDTEQLTVFFQGEKEHYGMPLFWEVGLLEYFELGGASEYTIHHVPQDHQTLWLEVEQADRNERLVMVAGNMGIEWSRPVGDPPSKDYFYVVWDEPDPPRSMLAVSPGPGPGNPPAFRAFLASHPEVQAAQRNHGPAAGYGLTVCCGDIDGDSVEEVIAGSGPDPLAPPRFAAYRLNGKPIEDSEADAYGISRYGVNVAAGDIDGDGFDEIVTGPGPGTVFGPHVRGWNHDGDTIQSMNGVNFFAYGTPRWGVNVAAGDIDGDGFDEIITGAGPGSIYGPHVRAWNHDGGTNTTAIPEISFFAYGTPRWGVNVAAGDIDGDGIDEIVTGPGPGRVYGPHIRGWEFDGSNIDPMTGVSFMSYGTFSYGVNVACGDIDEDGIDEIITGPGPGAEFGAHVRAFDYDGGPITPVERINFLAFPYSGADMVRYGCRVAVADMMTE